MCLIGLVIKKELCIALKYEEKKNILKKIYVHVKTENTNSDASFMALSFSQNIKYLYSISILKFIGTKVKHTFR